MRKADGSKYDRGIQRQIPLLGFYLLGQSLFQENWIPTLLYLKRIQKKKLSIVAVCFDYFTFRQRALSI
jgi:hypothetical protein